MRKNLLTKEQIEEKKIRLKEKMEQTIEDKKNGINPTQKFLLEIKDLIEMGLKNNMPFTAISNDIQSIYNLKLSTQTLRTFAVVNLGYLPKKNNNKKPVENREKIVVKPVAEKIEKNLTVEEMKKIQSSNLQNDDESL